MNIVAVGIDASNLASLENILNKLDFAQSFISFSDPLLVIKHSVEHQIDLVFTEINISRMDGFTMVNMLREKYPGIKAIVVTDAAQYEDRPILQKIDDYLLKPIDSVTAEFIITHLFQSQDHKRKDIDKSMDLGVICGKI